MESGGNAINVRNRTANGPGTKIDNPPVRLIPPNPGNSLDESWTEIVGCDDSARHQTVSNGDIRQVAQLELLRYCWPSRERKPVRFSRRAKVRVGRNYVNIVSFEQNSFSDLPDWKAHIGLEQIGEVALVFG